MNTVVTRTEGAPMLLGAELRMWKVIERGVVMPGVLEFTRDPIGHSVRVAWATCPAGRWYLVVELPVVVLLRLHPGVPSTLEWDWDEFRRIVAAAMEREQVAAARPPRGP